jgi:hypothetical protein
MQFGSNVPIPDLMRKNKRDRRGYPIPYIVFRDKNGKPQFTVNDGRMVKRCLDHNRCGICGNKLGDLVFFVGGTGSAFHPNGAYIDPPMHKECATYSLQVCPYLAFRPYTGVKKQYTIEDGEDDRMIVVDNTVMPGKPEVFVLKGSEGFVNMQDYRSPRLVPTTADVIEFWKDGKRLDETADEELIMQAMETSLGAVEELNSSVSTGPIVSSVHTLATLAMQNGE